MSTGYRPPSREPKGAWARHLHAARKERNWSASKAFEEWHEGLNLSRRSRSAYLALDMGDRQPKPHEAKYLISVIGAPPPESEPTVEPTLVAALSALVDELRESRREREALESRLRALEAGVGLLARQADVELPDPISPRA